MQVSLFPERGTEAATGRRSGFYGGRISCGSGIRRQVLTKSENRIPLLFQRKANIIESGKEGFYEDGKNE